MYVSTSNEQIFLKLSPFLKLPKALKTHQNNCFFLYENFLCPQINFIKTELFSIHPENLPVACQLCQCDFTQCSSMSNKKILHIPWEQPHPCLLSNSEAGLFQALFCRGLGCSPFTHERFDIRERRQSSRQLKVRGMQMVPIRGIVLWRVMHILDCNEQNQLYSLN